MTEKKTAEQKQVFIEREDREDETGQFVCVNGRSFLVPRGKLVSVPPAVAEVLDHANEMQRASAAYARDLRIE